uniref:Uncharacterized protein n=1 Tax=Glossina pallidipes TaxID=7398 RepID=A0A1B0AJE5_GLOPL
MRNDDESASSSAATPSSAAKLPVLRKWCISRNTPIIASSSIDWYITAAVVVLLLFALPAAVVALALLLLVFSLTGTLVVDVASVVVEFLLPLLLEDAIDLRIDVAIFTVSLKGNKMFSWEKLHKVWKLCAKWNLYDLRKDDREV